MKTCGNCEHKYVKILRDGRISSRCGLSVPNGLLPADLTTPNWCPLIPTMKEDENE